MGAVFLALRMAANAGQAQVRACGCCSRLKEGTTGTTYTTTKRHLWLSWNPVVNFIHSIRKTTFSSENDRNFVENPQSEFRNFVSERGKRRIHRRGSPDSSNGFHRRGLCTGARRRDVQHFSTLSRFALCQHERIKSLKSAQITMSTTESCHEDGYQLVSLTS